MLRIGLTGSLGSGKSTVAGLLRNLGAQVIEADELGRTLMEPGQPVYAEIVRVFGAQVVGADGKLNRPKLAELAFQGNRLQQLNAIVHPAVITAQHQWMNEVFARDPYAVAVVESALIFEVERDARARGEHEGVLSNWRNRFDRIVVVTVPDELKVQRYANRICPEEADPQGPCHTAAAIDARARLARQIPDAEKASRADYVLENTGDKSTLETHVAELWQQLKAQLETGTESSPQNLGSLQ